MHYLFLITHKYRVRIKEILVSFGIIQRLSFNVIHHQMADGETSGNPFNTYFIIEII